MIEFNLELIEDPYVREIMQRVREEFRDQVLLRGQWRFVTISFTSNITNFKHPHKLGFTPKHMLDAGKTGTGSIAYNIGRWDETNLDLTTSGTSASDPLVVSFYIGRYEEAGKV